MEKIKFCDMFKFLSEHPNYNIYISNPTTSYFTMLPDGELPLKNQFQCFFLFESDKEQVTYKDLNKLKEINSKYVSYRVID